MIPLCIDCDGTLVRSDLFIESLVRVLLRKPWFIPILPFWLFQGRHVLKYKVAELCDIDVSNIPLRQEVLEYALAEKSRGARLYLVTAADVGAKIIYTSTNKVYGNNVNNVEIMELDTRYDYSGNYKSIGLPETLSIDANHHTPYGISKLVGELYVREFGGIANRCSCMYGPNQFGIVDQGWMSHIATNKILGRETVIYGDGKQVRDALHITDVVNLMRMQMEALSGSNYSKVSGNAYNVGGGYANTISLIELCRLWEITPFFSSWRPADQKVFYCDVTRARQDFGWSPKVKLDHGLAELYAWTVSSLTNR